MKSFMAYLRTFLLCFGMLHLSMLPGYALAQENESNGNVSMPGVVEEAEAQQNEEAQQSGSSSGNSNSSSRKQVSNVDTQQGKGADGGAVQGLMDLVIMIGVGLLAKSLIMYTPVTTDMMIASAGGAAYLYGEIATLDATKEKMESETFVLTRYEDGSTNNMQRDALEKQKKSYEDLAEMMDTKASMKKTAAAAFLAAAAVALIWQAKVEAASLTCITSAQAEGAARAYADGGACLAGAQAASANESTCLALDMAPDATSMAGKAESETCSNTSMMTISAVCQASIGTCGVVNNLRRMLTTASTAGFMQSFIIGGVGALLMDQMGIGPLSGLITAATTNLFGYHDTIMASPYLRSLSYTVLAGLAFAGASTSEEQADKMRDNAETIQKMLDKVYDLEDSSVASLENEEQQLEVKNNLEPSEDFERGIESEQLICGPNAKEKMKKGENCQSQEKRIAENVEEDKENGIGNLPGAVVEAAGQIGNVADSLRETGGLTDGAFSDAQKLSSNADALRRLNNRIRDQINEARIKRGQEPHDFEGQQNKIAGEMKEAILKTFDENPEQTSRAIAAFRSQLPESLNEEAGEALASDLQESKNLAAKESEAFKMPEIETEDFSMDFDDEPKEASVSFGDDGQAVVDVDENLDTDGNDIVSNKDVSIFKVISVRYMKSGIPRLMDLE